MSSTRKIVQTDLPHHFKNVKRRSGAFRDDLKYDSPVYVASPCDLDEVLGISQEERTSKKTKKDIEQRALFKHEAPESSPKLNSMVFYRDPVHKSIELEDICVKIIDTPQFQRLHGLKQLGASDFVYRGATHTRFNHCVGVAHLAGRLADNLRLQQPYLKITRTDVLCVKLAGLCHDLGHGPLSHLFDGAFLEKVWPNAVVQGVSWSHELGSVLMLRHLLATNDINIRSYGLTETDLSFIEEMILGTPEHERIGRGNDKEFLYEIVSNSRSGLDVDKMDYYLRDVQATGVSSSNRFDRFLELARVANAKDEKGELHQMICYPEKLITEALQFFATRKELHKMVYQHKTTVAVELMLVDALVLANKHVKIRGTKTREHPDGMYKISETIKDMVAYTKLKDSIVDLIENEPGDSLHDAVVILDRLKQRKLYKHVGSTRIDPSLKITEKDILNQLVQTLYCGQTDSHQSDFENLSILTQNEVRGSTLSEEDLRVRIINLHYGQKGENPVSKMRFYKKDAVFEKNKESAFEVNESKYEDELPRSFQIKRVSLYCCSTDTEKQRQAVTLFENWCNQEGMSEPFLSCSQDF